MLVSIHKDKYLSCRFIQKEKIFTHDVWRSIPTSSDIGWESFWAEGYYVITWDSMKYNYIQEQEKHVFFE